MLIAAAGKGLVVVLLKICDEWGLPYAGLLTASLNVLLLISGGDVNPNVGHPLLQETGLLCFQSGEVTAIQN